jgi:IS30 family transposase
VLQTGEQPQVGKYRRKQLQLQWSPEQIAEWLKHTFSGSEDDQVSHERFIAASSFRPVVR